jgi:hypothetical protein
MIGRDGSLQGSRGFTHGFVSGKFDQHGISFHGYRFILQNTGRSCCA